MFWSLHLHCQLIFTSTVFWSCQIKTVYFHSQLDLELLYRDTYCVWLGLAEKDKTQSCGYCTVHNVCNICMVNLPYTLFLFFLRRILWCHQWAAWPRTGVKKDHYTITVISTSCISILHNHYTVSKLLIFTLYQCLCTFLSMYMYMFRLHRWGRNNIEVSSHFCKYFIISFHVTTLKKLHFDTM